MNKPSRVIIEQVANGFIFGALPASDFHGVDMTEREVFQSMAGLTARLEKHFTHRSGEIPADEVSIQPTA